MDLGVIEHYAGIPSGIFEDNRYYPNELVHDTVLKAFEKTSMVS